MIYPVLYRTGNDCGNFRIHVIGQSEDYHGGRVRHARFVSGGKFYCKADIYHVQGPVGSKGKTDSTD